MLKLSVSFSLIIVAGPYALNGTYVVEAHASSILLALG